MFNFAFSEEKNQKLKLERGISFEMVIQAIDNSKLLATISHPNKNKYENQKMFVVEINGYAYVVPFIEDEEKNELFLKTIFPSRKMHKLYLGGK